MSLHTLLLAQGNSSLRIRLPLETLFQQCATHFIFCKLPLISDVEINVDSHLAKLLSQMPPGSSMDLPMSMRAVGAAPPPALRLLDESGITYLLSYLLAAVMIALLALVCNNLPVPLIDA